MPLTNKAIANASAKEKPLKLYDERGLFLLVNPNGSKWWRFKYRIGGKEKSLSFGTYPDVSLKEARDRREAARRMRGNGIDPAAHRRVMKETQQDANGGSFEVIAREWFTKRSSAWKSSHSEKIINRLEHDIFPHIGKRPVGQLTAPEVLAVLRRIESRGAIETAHRAMQNCSQVFRYAVATGRAERDPTVISNWTLQGRTCAQMHSLKSCRSIRSPLLLPSGRSRTARSMIWKPVTAKAIRAGIPRNTIAAALWPNYSHSEKHVAAGKFRRPATQRRCG